MQQVKKRLEARENYLSNIKYGKGYDIVRNPDQFKLTIDGKTYE